MATIELSEKDMEILKLIIQVDVNDVAEDVSFFEDPTINPKEYIDDRIELCKKFGLDFWSIVGLYNNHFVLKRLEALYNGQDLNEFVATYEKPSESWIVTDFAKRLFSKR